MGSEGALIPVAAREAFDSTGASSRQFERWRKRDGVVPQRSWCATQRLQIHPGADRGGVDWSMHADNRNV
jgi:hypothetical protein